MVSQFLTMKCSSSKNAKSPAHPGLGEFRAHDAPGGEFYAVFRGGACGSVLGASACVVLAALRSGSQAPRFSRVRPAVLRGGCVMVQEKRDLFACGGGRV